MLAAVLAAALGLLLAVAMFGCADADTVTNTVTDTVTNERTVTDMVTEQTTVTEPARTVTVTETVTVRRSDDLPETK